MIDSAGVFSTEEIPVASALAEIRMGGCDPDYHFLFARDLDKNLLGYTCYGPIPLTEHRYNLYWVLVNPQARGLGLGRELMAETERSIREAGGQHIYVETPGTDVYLDARRFYRHHGFTEFAICKDFYRNGEDKILFRKELGA